MSRTRLVATAREKAAAAHDTATEATTDYLDRLTTAGRTIGFAAVLAFLALVQPVMAQPAGCSVPSDLQPVFDLLNAITQATAALGIAAATLGIVAAGIFYMMPGPDNTRRAKSTIITTVIGVAIILLANALVSFITTNIGNTVCTGGASASLTVAAQLI